MGSTVSSPEGIPPRKRQRVVHGLHDLMSVECKLVEDNDGHFAGLVPVDFLGPADGRRKALEFAHALVTLSGKNFDPSCHVLKIPGVPAGHVDIGVHCSTHNSKFNGGPLTDEQIRAIRDCLETFTLTVNLTDFKVLVGSPSNDTATGIIGYVGLLITAASLAEYNRAVAVYGGQARDGNIAHVSICGWTLKGFATTTEARKAFGLTTADDQKYPDGSSFYTANVFPSPLASSGEAKKTTNKMKKKPSTRTVMKSAAATRGKSAKKKARAKVVKVMKKKNAMKKKPLRNTSPFTGTTKAMKQ